MSHSKTAGNTVICKIVDLPNVNSPQTKGQPGISVQVRRRLWTKIVFEKHFASTPESWKVLLSEELFDQLLDHSEGAMVAATKKILPEIVQSMATPLVIFHMVKGSDVRVWLAILPCGLHAYIRRPHKAGQRYLASLHFKGRKEDKLKQMFSRKRGFLSHSTDASILAKEEQLAAALQKYLTVKKAIEHTIGRYTNRTDRKSTLPHTLDEISLKNKSNETAQRIQFLLPEQWGFNGRRAGASWTMPKEYPEQLWEPSPAKVVVES